MTLPAARAQIVEVTGGVSRMPRFTNHHGIKFADSRGASKNTHQNSGLKRYNRDIFSKTAKDSTRRFGEQLKAQRTR